MLEVTVFLVITTFQSLALHEGLTESSKLALRQILG